MSNEMFEMVKNREFKDSELKAYFDEIKLDEARTEAEKQKKKASEYKSEMIFWRKACFMAAFLIASIALALSFAIVILIQNK